MRLDFSGSLLNSKAFSRRPMTFCEPATKISLFAICDKHLQLKRVPRSAAKPGQAAQLQPRRLLQPPGASLNPWQGRSTSPRTSQSPPINATIMWRLLH